MLLVVLVGGAVGCDAPEETSSGGEAEASGGDGGGEAQRIAEAGDLEVTMGDYERFLQRTRLFAPADGAMPAQLPARRKAHPRLQSRTVRSLLENAVIRREAARRGIEVDENEVDEFVRAHEKLGRFLPQADAAQEAELGLPDGLGREDLREVARVRLLRRALREKLLAGLDGDDLWEMYRRRHDTMRLGYVSLENTPTPDKIDAFVDETPTSEFEAYLGEHPERYRRPKLVELAIVKPKRGGEVDEETLREAAGRLQEGGSVEEIASELDLAYESKAHLVRRENEQAFGADRGETGYQTSGPRGAYAWRVEGWREGGEPELDRGLKRELASEMLQESPVDSVEKQLEPVLEAMRGVERQPSGELDEEALERLDQKIDRLGLTLETSEISRAGGERIPGLGLAESVVEAAFALDEASPPVVDEPVLSRGRLVALTQIERDRPDREAFEANRQAFRHEIVEEKKDSIVREFLDEWFTEHQPEMRMQPIRKRYGVANKKPQ